MLGNFLDAQVPAQLQHIGGKPPAYSLVRIHERKGFHQDTAVWAAKLSIGQGDQTACIKEIKVPDCSPVIGVYLPDC
jgi:hypothetical protein